MGNTGSNYSRRRNSPPPLIQPLQPQINANGPVSGADGRQFTSQYLTPHNQYPGFYPQSTPVMTVQVPIRFDRHHIPLAPHHLGPTNRMGMVASVELPLPPAPHVEHQKAVTIRNDVNVEKQSLRLEQDDQNPGHYLVAFTFNATAAGCMTIIFFGKEGEDGQLRPTKENLLEPITMHFQQGLNQKFRQPPGTGIDFSLFEEAELLKGEMDIHPLTILAEASPLDEHESVDQSHGSGPTSSQITQAVFEHDEGKYRIRAVKQILCVNGVRYELQEIYGIGNSADTDFDDNDPGKACVICLSESRDTTVLPCRHMCMCRACAKVLSFQTNLCPVCRQPIERMLEISITNGTDD